MDKMNPSSLLNQTGSSIGSVWDEATVVQLMRCLAATHDNACNCDEAFALLDEYTELLLADGPVASLMPLVKAHLDHCASCQEACQALLHVLQMETEA